MNITWVILNIRFIQIMSWVVVMEITNKLDTKG